MNYLESPFYEMDIEKLKKQKELDALKPKQDTYPFGQTLGAIGFATGVAYSFAKKTGFWKGWGIAIIGSIALGGIGYGIDSFNNKNK